MHMGHVSNIKTISRKCCAICSSERTKPCLGFHEAQPHTQFEERMHMGMAPQRQLSFSTVFPFQSRQQMAELAQACVPHHCESELLSGCQSASVQKTRLLIALGGGARIPEMFMNEPSTVCTLAVFCKEQLWLHVRSRSLI